MQYILQTLSEANGEASFAPEIALGLRPGLQWDIAVVTRRELRQLLSAASP